jgi:hypothetical protein
MDFTDTQVVESLTGNATFLNVWVPGVENEPVGWTVQRANSERL